MKRLLPIVAVLFGMALAAASPAQAWSLRECCGPGFHRLVYGRYYNPYYYGPYGPPASGYYGGYPGSPGYGGYPGWPGGVGVY